MKISINYSPFLGFTIEQTKSYTRTTRSAPSVKLNCFSFVQWHSCDIRIRTQVTFEWEFVWHFFVLPSRARPPSIDHNHNRKFFIFLCVCRYFLCTIKGTQCGVWLGKFRENSGYQPLESMINVVSKSGNLTPYLKATAQVVANGLKPIAAAAVLPKETVVAQPGTAICGHSLNKFLARGPVSVVSGPAGTRFRADLNFSNFVI